MLFKNLIHLRDMIVVQKRRIYSSELEAYTM